jgi:hypothetical protein
MKGISVDNADLAVRSDIDKAVTLAAIQTFPMEPSPHDEFTYAFDRGLLGTAEAWSGTQANNEEPSPLEFLIRAIPMVEITDWLHKALENLSSTDIGNQVLIASLIRMKTYMGVIPADTIWEFISDPKWARKALLSLDLSALEIFCQAMTEIQVQYNDKWAIQMPHFYAYGCEQIEAKGERRKALFAYTIIGSINGGTTSAIRRLLHGRFKGRFRGDRADIRKYLESFRSILPAWASAKLRAIMANLHIT